jgi:Spy/CpxP family protein refolding chaperone
MRKSWKYSLFAIVGALTFSGALAVAGEHYGRGAFMKRMAGARIEAALDLVNATPQQRDQIHKVQERVFQSMGNLHRERGQTVDQLLGLFTAERIDANQLQNLRSAREGDMRRMVDEMQRAFVEVHDILTPAQRKILADEIAQRRRAHQER